MRCNPGNVNIEGVGCPQLVYFWGSPIRFFNPIYWPKNKIFVQSRNPVVSLTAVFVSSRNALLQQGRYVTRQKRLRRTLVILTDIFSITHFLHTFKPESCPCSASFKIPDPGLYIRKVKNRLYQGPSFRYSKEIRSNSYIYFYGVLSILWPCKSFTQMRCWCRYITII